MSETLDIAIDAGQTGVRLGVARGGRLLARCEGPGLAYGGAPGPAAVVLDCLAEPWRRLAPDAPIGSVCLGLTSVPGSDAEYLALARGLLDRFAATRVLLCGDGLDGAAALAAAADLGAYAGLLRVVNR